MYKRLWACLALDLNLRLKRVLNGIELIFARRICLSSYFTLQSSGKVNDGSLFSSGCGCFNVFVFEEVSESYPEIGDVNSKCAL